MKYSDEIVGGNAGKIWKALNENGALSITKLVDATGEKKDDILIAIGWLLREGKLDSREEKRTSVFFLK